MIDLEAPAVVVVAALSGRGRDLAENPVRTGQVLQHLGDASRRVSRVSAEIRDLQCHLGARWSHEMVEDVDG